MRLNVWMRAGIVATVLWLIAVPLYFQMDAKAEWMKIIDATRALCMSDVERGPIEGFSKGHAKCWADWTAGLDRSPDIYVEAFQGSLVVALITWALAFAITYTARWVLAGRKPKPS